MRTPPPAALAAAGAVSLAVAPSPARAARLAAAIAVLLALAPAPARAALTVSPAPGTTSASPATQISILGAPRRAIRSVAIVASRSGRHAGRIAAYVTGEGASFLPRRPFVPHERVRVRVTWVERGTRRRLSFSFAVAEPLRGLRLATPVRSVHRHSYRFVSRPDLHPPMLEVTERAPGTAGGDILLAPLTAPGYRLPMYGDYGPMVVTDRGELVWSRPAPRGDIALDLERQTYRGRPVLTWWQGRFSYAGYGLGEDMVVDGAYRRIAVIRAGNGYGADGHELQLTASGSAWLVAYSAVRVDLARFGVRHDGIAIDGVVQQVDPRTGLVMFEWHALDHIPLADSYSRPSRPGEAWDAYHLNSVDATRPGEILVSARNTWAAYAVSTRTGAISWRLGGRHSSFALAAGARFAWQHDVRFSAGGVSMFDNEATPTEGPQSRALFLTLDARDRTASVDRAYGHAPPLLAVSQGNVESLGNGNVFVGWGSKQSLSELAPDGRPLFDARLPGPDDSYRALRAEWVGRPRTRPAVATRRVRGGSIDLYASWNGATEVVRWQVLTGRSRHRLAAVATVDRTGFETRIGIAAPARWIAVTALAADGRALGTSRAVPP